MRTSALHLMLAAPFLTTIMLTGCSKSCTQDPTAERGRSQQEKTSEDSKPDYSGINVKRVVKRDLEKGTGVEVTENSQVSVSYSTWVYDPKKVGNKGPEIATSGEQQLQIQLGKGKLIKGWEQGMLGMKVGGERELIIPPELAYGDNGQPPQIPPGAIVLVHVRLHSVD